MLVMDGLTAVRRIREMEASGELPGKRNKIFALTGNAREGQVENIRSAGMDDVLVRLHVCRIATTASFLL